MRKFLHITLVWLAQRELESKPAQSIFRELIFLIYLVAGANLYIVIQNDVIVASS